MAKAKQLLDEVYIKSGAKCILCACDLIANHPDYVNRDGVNQLRKAVRIVKFRLEVTHQMEDIFQCCVPSRDPQDIQNRLDSLGFKKDGPWNAKS